MTGLEPGKVTPRFSATPSGPKAASHETRQGSVHGQTFTGSQDLVDHTKSAAGGSLEGQQLHGLKQGTTPTTARHTTPSMGTVPRLPAGAQSDSLAFNEDAAPKPYKLQDSKTLAGIRLEQVPGNPNAFEFSYNGHTFTARFSPQAPDGTAIEEVTKILKSLLTLALRGKEEGSLTKIDSIEFRDGEAKMLRGGQSEVVGGQNADPEQHRIGCQINELLRQLSKLLNGKPFSLHIENAGGCRA